MAKTWMMVVSPTYFFVLFGPLACSPAPPPAKEFAPADENIGTNVRALTDTLPIFPWKQLAVYFTNVNSGKCLDVTNGGTLPQTNVQQLTCVAQNKQTWFLVPTGFNFNEYQIRSTVGGNRTLIVHGAGLGDGVNVEIDTFNSGWEEIWNLNKQGDGSYEIRSKKSGKCLDVAGGSTADGANVQQYTCNGGASQHWFVTARMNPFNLVAQHSDKCVDVANASTADGANVQQYTCLRQENQRWYIQYDSTVGTTTYWRILSNNSGKCLDVAGASLADGANIQQYTCNGGGNQAWQITADSTGFVEIRSKLSNKCVDVAGVSTADNANIQQYTCNYGPNQRFFWSNFVARHVQVVDVADSSGNSRTTETNDAISAHVNRANAIYKHYGIQLSYNFFYDRSQVNNDGLFNLGKSTMTYTCPDGSTGRPEDCANRYAANWPTKFVIFSRQGGGFADGFSNYLVIGQMNPSTTYVCTNVPDTQWLGHEFGHYMGLSHTFWDTAQTETDSCNNQGNLNADTLFDTPDDPFYGAGDSSNPLTCLAPHSSTGTFHLRCGFSDYYYTVGTNLVMSYYYNDTVTISPAQGALTRATSFARGF